MLCRHGSDAPRHASSRTRRWLAIAVWGAYVPTVSPYLSQKLTRPLVTKDGGTLRTVKDARAYMLALSKQRETRAQRQQAAELLLDGATVADFSKTMELALFCDAKLDVAATT
jgi:hypothetical protein